MVFSFLSYNEMFFAVEVMCYLSCCLRVVIFVVEESAKYLLVDQSN